MRYAVFSDVHANLPALERFVDQTRAEVDAYICLGDVVNYGPWNDECLDLVISLPGIVYIEGNHERLFCGTRAAARRPKLRPARGLGSYPRRSGPCCWCQWCIAMPAATPTFRLLMLPCCSITTV